MPLDIGYTTFDSVQIAPPVGDNAILLRGENSGVPRISTMTESGAAVSIPSTYGFGEAIELRYSSALSNTQIQGIFLQVDTSVANTSTVRGVEIAARRSAAVAVGTLMGGNIVAYTGNGVNTGNITTMYGLSCEAQIDDTYTGTIAEFAGLRVKLQTEDGATVTASYGIIIDNEYVTGGKTLTAMIRMQATSGTGADCLIDASGVQTTVSDTDKVLLFKFKRSDGTTVFCRYDTSDNALAFGTS